MSPLQMGLISCIQVEEKAVHIVITEKKRWAEKEQPLLQVINYAVFKETYWAYFIQIKVWLFLLGMSEGIAIKSYPKTEGQ